MIRCLIDEPSFDKVRQVPGWENHHPNLEALSDMIETTCNIVRDEGILLINDDFNVVVTCDPELVSFESPGMHFCGTNNAPQTVYLSGVYPFREMIEFLAHELVHVEQTTLGWISYDEEIPAICWFGHPMKFTHEEVSDEIYRNYPWERDAYRRQDEVFRQLRKALDRDTMEAIWPSDSDVTKNDSSVSRSLN